MKDNSGLPNADEQARLDFLTHHQQSSLSKEDFDLLHKYWKTEQVQQLLMHLWSLPPNALPAKEVDLAEKRLIKFTHPFSGRKTVFQLSPSFYRWAAVIILSAGLGLGYYQVYKTQLSKAPTQPIATTEQALANEAQYRLLAHTANGQRTKLNLQDGSTVELNAASALYIRKGYGDETRTVYLIGEGFFEVKPNKDKPFVVYSGGQKVQVLGTSFNVRAYPGERQVVSVLTGKVNVGDSLKAEPKQILIPGQSSVRSVNGSELITYSGKSFENVLWRNSVLYFNKATVAEIARELARWYDVEVEVKVTGSQNCTYSGRFYKEQLSTVLNSLAFAEGFKFSIEGKKVRLEGKVCG